MTDQLVDQTENPPEAVQENQATIQEAPAVVPETEIRKAEKPAKAKKGFFSSPWLILIAALLYGGIYMAVYSYLKPVAKDIDNATILKIFTDYSIYVGWVLALVSMIAAYIVYLIKKIVRLGWLTPLNPIIWALAVLPWYLAARQLVFFEKRYIDIAKGLIDYVGQPLLLASYIVFAVTGVWLIASIVAMFVHKKS
jgi:hypothetical protein